jgi:hypothetical protein
MIDLFRFVMLRPPKVPATGATVAIAPSQKLLEQFGDFLNPTTSAEQLAGRARELLASDAGAVKNTTQLAYGAQYQLFNTALDASDPATITGHTVKQIFNFEPKELVKTRGFSADRAAAADTLILTKLASDGTQVDVAALNAALRATTVISNLATSDLNPVLSPTFVFAALPLRREGPAPPAIADSTLSTSEPSKVVAMGGAEQIALENAHAIRVLASIPSTQFTVIQLPGVTPTATPAGSGVTSSKSKAKLAGSGLGGIATTLPKNILTIAPATLKLLDPVVTQVAKRLNLNLSTTPVPQLIDAIKVAASSSVIKAKPVALGRVQIVSSEDPVPSLPTGPGSVVSPIGIGDLLVVKQRLKRYEAKDIAYIENVLRTETFKRDTRRLDRTQTTITTESDTTTEEERDTQATDRFSLQRESARTIKEDNSLKAGLAVSASYGPTVSLKANLDVASSSSVEDSSKQATSFSKDITSRSATKITQTTKQIQSMLTLNEYEENIHHGFDNTAAGASNISGVYQWVDKVYEAQVYNYGPRLMFDVMVPEPAAFLIALSQSQTKESLPPKPNPLTVNQEHIDDVAGSPNNYLTLGEAYGVTGLDPPPDTYQVVSAEFGMDSLDPNKNTTKSGELKVPEGYSAISVMWVGDFSAGGTMEVIIGDSVYQSGIPKTLNSVIGTLPFALGAFKVFSFFGTITMNCQLTPRSHSAWQEKVYAAIQLRYQQLQDAYDKAVNDVAPTLGVAIRGQNPDLNLALVKNELKKSCITLMTGQHYEAFGAIQRSTVNNMPEVRLADAEVQGKYVRFLEESFEWEQITYFLYPYYWGRKDRWPLHVLATDPDPQFSAFLNAGYARVVFPVCPGFEPAVLHLLETGEVYNGSDFPSINSNLYKNIVADLKEQQGAPGSEKAQGDPWEITLPTTLVKLRSDDKLPYFGWDNSTPPLWVELGAK